jgi:hypothetical protein
MSPALLSPITIGPVSIDPSASLHIYNQKVTNFWRHLTWAEDAHFTLNTDGQKKATGCHRSVGKVPHQRLPQESTFKAKLKCGTAIHVK